jgi:hypothetical protein
VPNETQTQQPRPQSPTCEVPALSSSRINDALSFYESGNGPPLLKRVPQANPTPTATVANQAPLPITEHDVAFLCGVSVHLVRKWRMRGTGPAYRKLSPGRGGAVRYDPAAVKAFLDSKTRMRTSD